MGKPEPELEIPEESEIEDPFTTLRQKCHDTKPISRLYKILLKCNDRVNAKTKTEETCMEELFDYVHALDHCATKNFIELAGDSENSKNKN